MGILDYIERVKRENEGPRITAQEPRIGLKPGGIVEPGVVNYGTLTEAEKRANVKTWEKNTGLNLEDVEKKQQYKIRAGDVAGVGSGRKIKWTPKQIANYKNWIKLYSLEEYNKLHPDSQRHVREGLPVKAIETRGKNLNDFFTKEVSKANAGEKFVSQIEILNKANKEFKLKKINTSAYPVLTTLETRADKIDQTLRNMLMEDKPLKNFWQDAILKRTGLNNITLQRTLDSGKVKTYNVLADQGAAFIRQNIPKSRGVYDFIKNLSFSDQLSKALEIIEGRPMLTGIQTVGGRASAPRFKVMQFAFRSWDQNQGKGPIQFFDKNGKPITWDFGKKLPVGEITFEYKGKKYNTKNLSDPSLLKSDFPEVYKTVTESNNFLRREIDNPFKPGEKISVRKLVKKIQVDGYKWSPKTGSLAILHGSEGVKNKPFTNLAFNTTDINQVEQVLERKLTSKKITESQYNKAIKNLKGLFTGTSGLDFEKSIIRRITSQAKDIQKGHSLELGKLLIKLCPKGSASGGRIGFKSGTPTVACGMDQLTKYLKNGVPKTEKTLVARILGMGNKLIKGAGQMLNPVEFFKLKNWVSAPALAAFGLFETGFVADDVLRKNKPLNEAAADNWLTGMMFNLDSQVEQAKNILGSNKHQLSPAAKEYAQSLIDVKRHDDLSARVGALDPEIKANVKSEMATIRHNVRHRGETGRFDYESALADKIDAASAGEYVGEPVKRDLMPGWWAKDADDEWRKVNEVGYAIKGASFDAPDKPGLPSFTSGFASAAKNIGKGKALISAQTKKQFVPGEYIQKKGQLPEPKVIDVPAYVSETFKPDLPTKENLNRLFQLLGVAHPRFGQVPEETLDLMIKQEKWRQLMERPEMKGSQERFADGGLANLTRTVARDSGPMQGLASTPEYATYRKEYKWQT